MSKETISLSRRQLLGGVASSLMLFVSRPGFASADLLAIRIWPSSTYTRLTFESNAPLQFKQVLSDDARQIRLDLDGLTLSNTLGDIGRLIRAQDPFVSSAKAIQLNPQTVRITLTLKTEVNPQIFTLNPVAEFKNRLVVDLYPKEDTADPLLALLQDYNKGKLDDTPQLKPQKGRAGIDRPIIIVLDPGHGGEDPGAVGPSGTREKDIVLAIAKRLKNEMSQDKNMRVYLTREDDVFIPLGVRVAKARKLRADLFISIHADAFTTPTAKGSSVFALSEGGATSSFARLLAKTQNNSDLIGGVKIMSQDKYLAHTLLDLTQTATINDSLKLGKHILNKLGNLNTLHKNKVDQASFAVLKAPDIPSVLVETAFISNPEEEMKLIDPNFQKELAQALYQGIRAYAMQGAVFAQS